MKKEVNMIEYIDGYIKFYKTAKTCGWDLEYMRKLIVKNLHNIKRKCIKDLESIRDRVNEERALYLSLREQGEE